MLTSAPRTETRVMRQVIAGASLSGDSHLADGAGSGADRGLSLQCLHPHAESLQLDAETVEVLPAERQSRE